MAVKFDRSAVLGNGIDGMVFLGTFAGEEVAVKRIQLRMDKDANDARQSREEEAMKKLEHPNVLKLIEVQKDLDFKYFILELCLGTVSDHIKGNYKGPMPSEIDGMIQMASGLQYIHSRQFVHRDIKPGNVLISKSHVLKISDFGFCRPVTLSGSFSMSSGPKGTRIYNSPEFHDSENKSPAEKEKMRANVSTDIFSLGCLFHTYITKGCHPFAKGKVTNETETIGNILNGNKFLASGESGLSKDHYAFSMIDGMTEKIAKDRWKLDLVLETLKSQKLILPQE
ncbi:serine/threonine-protein kinase/endoribonuclease IRE1-like [Daphnia carinata]|uniref:serine/threonine-protein kinase/endoribonuclease IRE1-like n=1 Tax=Daphnia carinata TaxID=120202 RepID=UPI00257F2CA5|nr:serine/threonine-protein kinase/endoribonuclease IRE1-like [Daphnia carinata]XP_059350556.1 serine/threonine-protein kinase/endoribonuclease IRE1-like [Daphnia carinata]